MELVSMFKAIIATFQIDYAAKQKRRQSYFNLRNSSISEFCSVLYFNCAVIYIIKWISNVSTPSVPDEG